MQDSMIKDFEKELLSLTCTDLKLNIRNGHIKRDFNWVIRQTKTFAHWTDIEPVFGKGYNIYKKQRDDFNNGLSVEYFKVVTIGEGHRYNDSSFLNTYGNQLRDNLMITYDINLNDLNRVNLLYRQIEKVYNEAVRLKECFDNSRNYFLENKDNNIVYLMAFESVPLSSPTLADWNNFEKVFLKKEVSTCGAGIYTVWGKNMVGELRTANNEVSYFTKDFFDDLTELFWYRKEVLGMIIKELEPKNTKIGRPQEQLQGFDLNLSVPQLETLHGLLIDDKFLIRCEFKHFKNAFNGEVLAEDFEPLEWIDKTQRNHFVSIQTVFQLLDSCKIDLRGEYNIIIQEVREKIKLIFKNNFGNIPSKFNEFNALKTKRHILIDSIINLKP